MIECSGISKHFRVARREAGFRNACKAFFRRETTVVPALDNISFSIADGEMVGYIGPNGAGKSTTIKIMCGVLTPDSGSCIINGRTPWLNRTAHVAEIGVVFGQRSQLWWDLPVGDSFALLGDIYGMKKADAADSLAELNRILALDELLRTPTRQLSLGQRMRCEIAAALLHRPKTLFLDEPTIGLDAVSKLAVRSFIRQINAERGTTVILTTHDMQDIEALTSRILLIGGGKILLDGNLDELKARRSAVRTIKLEYSSGEVCECEGMRVSSAHRGHAVCTVDIQKLSVSGAIEFISKTAEITDLSVEGTSAEELVVSLYKEFDI